MNVAAGIANLVFSLLGVVAFGVMIVSEIARRRRERAWDVKRDKLFEETAREIVERIGPKACPRCGGVLISIPFPPMGGPPEIQQ